MATEEQEMEQLANLRAAGNRMLSQYLESQQDLWRDYVDPREAYLGPDGEIWQAIGAGNAGGIDLPPYQTEQELESMRAVGRLLWRANEFAQNGHENRISYIVGYGHTYTVVGRQRTTSTAMIDRVQDVVDQFLEANNWAIRQQEILLRYDRDGEVFQRKFCSGDGILRLRFIEPRNVRQPPSPQSNEGFGIATEANDIESVRAYWIAGNDNRGEWIEADKIEHRKANVDSGLKRGIPLFWSVRKNLARATKLLRNMSVATEIQTAIALIRKHQQATKEAVRSFITARRDDSYTDANGKTKSVLNYGPGSIIDAPQGMEYSFPTAGLDPTKTVAALQAELRAVASRLVMPEFMLTSDASNANFSSTMVAEGPAVKKFERDQQTQISFDIRLIDDALAHAVASGLLSEAEVKAVKVTATPPTVQVRDGLKEAQQRQIDMGLGILSPQTATAESGRDWKTEQNNLEQATERGGGVLTGDRPELPAAPSEDGGGR